MDNSNTIRYLDENDPTSMVEYRKEKAFQEAEIEKFIDDFLFGKEEPVSLRFFQMKGRNIKIIVDREGGGVTYVNPH